VKLSDRAILLFTLAAMTILVASLLFVVPALAQNVHAIYQGARYDNSYDPWVVQLPDRYVMVRCRNFENHDSIYRSESRDGITGWTDGSVIARGEVWAQDDLSCSPGLVVAPDGVWHLYYTTAARQTPTLVEIWHSVSADGGETWTKFGKVTAVPITDGYSVVLQPSPAIENGRIVVYLVANWSGKTCLWRMEDLTGDGQQFTSPSVYSNAETCQARPGAKLAYANVRGGGCAIQPNLLYLDGTLVLESTPGMWYADYVGTGNYLPGPPARLYFYGGVRYPNDDPLNGMPFITTTGVLVFDHKPVGHLGPFTPVVDRASASATLFGTLYGSRPNPGVIGAAVTVTQGEAAHATTSGVGGTFTVADLSLGPATVSVTSTTCFNVSVPVTLHAGANNINIQTCP
jgi:hypothetical protein